jgi:hypothetical protein
MGGFLMPKKGLRLYLEHIRETIGLIVQSARGRQRPDLDDDPMLRQAIEPESSGVNHDIILRMAAEDITQLPTALDPLLLDALRSRKKKE